jgi:hypothetical protein
MDCRWEPNRPLAQQRDLGSKDCMVMRRDADVSTTATVTRADARRVRTAPAMRSGAVGQAPAGFVMGTPMVAQVPAIPQRDCRYDPRYPVAAPYWIDQNGCLRMHRGTDDVFVTGTINGPRTGAPLGRIGNGTGNVSTGDVGVPPASGVSPVTDGPRGPVGNGPRGGTRTGNDIGGPKGGVDTGNNSGGPKGGVDGNNNGGPKGGGPVADNPGDDTPGGGNPRGGFTGNPGNDRSVGRAGESPNGRDFGDDARGRSDVEARGGPADHGNNGFGNGGHDGSNAGKQDRTR